MEDSIRNTVDDYVQAELAGDIEALRAILHEQFIAIGPLGFLLSKDEWIKRHQNGTFSYEQLTLDEISIREFEETAIVIARQDQVAGYKDQQVTAELRVSMMLIRQVDTWQMVGLQMSSIGQPPQFTPKKAA